MLGLRLGWTSRRTNRANAKPAAGRAAPGILAVAAIAVSNGGDNIGVYIPVLATAGRMEPAEYVCVFLLLIAVCCAAGRLLATRQFVARALQR